MSAERTGTYLAVRRGLVSVLLVTQVRLYAEGIAAALEEVDTIGKVAAEPSCSTALARLRREPFDVVLLDVAGIDDIAEAQEVASAAPPARVVALAVREHDQEVIAWAEHGATGIVTRQASFDDLRQVILAAARGECDCSPGVAGALLRRVAAHAVDRRLVVPHTPLTMREKRSPNYSSMGS